jgi:hypothetical protein
VVLWTSPAAAQTQGAAAEALFDQGHAAMDKGDYATACLRFRESDRLDPAIGTKLNLGICEEKRGRLATAWDLFRAVVDKADPTDERRAMAQDLAGKLEGRIPKLTIRLADGAPPDTTLREGELVLEGASIGIPLPMDPGKHRFLVTAPGHAERVLEVELRESEQKIVNAEPGPPQTPQAGAGPSTSTTSATEVAARPTGLPTLAWVAFGVGGAGLTLGVITGLVASGKHSTLEGGCNNTAGTCTPAYANDLEAFHTWRTISTVDYVVGALGVAGGATLWLTTPKSRSTMTARVWLGPASAGIAGRF